MGCQVVVVTCYYGMSGAGRGQGDAEPGQRWPAAARLKLRPVRPPGLQGGPYTISQATPYL